MSPGKTSATTPGAHPAAHPAAVLVIVRENTVDLAPAAGEESVTGRIVDPDPIRGSALMTLSQLAIVLRRRLLLLKRKVFQYH